MQLHVQRLQIWTFIRMQCHGVCPTSECMQRQGARNSNVPLPLWDGGLLSISRFLLKVVNRWSSHP